MGKRAVRCAVVRPRHRNDATIPQVASPSLSNRRSTVDLSKRVTSAIFDRLNLRPQLQQVVVVFSFRHQPLQPAILARRFENEASCDTRPLALPSAAA